MATFERSIDLDVPQRKVWDYLADFSHWEKFLTHRTSVTLATNRFRLADGSVAGVNAQVLMTYKDRLSLTWTIREWEPPKKLALDARHPSRLAGYRAAVAIELTPKTSLTTELRIRSEFEASALLGMFLFLPMFKRGVDKRLGIFLEQLKAELLA